jgi:hypothetical protein
VRVGTFDEPVEVHAGQAKKHDVGPFFSAANKEARRSRQQRKCNGEMVQGIRPGGFDDHGDRLVFNRDHGWCALGDRGQASCGGAGTARVNAGGGLPALGRRLRSCLGGHGRGHAGRPGMSCVGSGGDGEAMAVVNQGKSFEAGQKLFLCVECGVAHACVFHMQIRTSDVRRTSRRVVMNLALQDFISYFNTTYIFAFNLFISTIHAHIRCEMLTW